MLTAGGKRPCSGRRKCVSGDIFSRRSTFSLRPSPVRVSPVLCSATVLRALAPSWAEHLVSARSARTHSSHAASLANDQHHAVSGTAQPLRGTLQNGSP
jgi:hypothetical protein